MQPWRTPFPTWNQSVVPCPVLTIASWPAYKFLRRQVRWSGISRSWRILQFVVIHTVKGFGIVNKAEIDVFLKLSRFFNDPADVGNLISGSSAFSKTSLNIRKFPVHVLLKPSLENFEHYFTSMCCFYSVPQVLGCCVLIFIHFYAYSDFFFDFFCDLLVTQQRVVQPPYVVIFNSFSPVIEI